MFKVLQIECDDPEHTFLTQHELAENLGFPLSRLTGWRKVSRRVRQIPSGGLYEGLL